MNQALTVNGSNLPSPVHTLDAYVQAVSAIPVLSTEQEQQLALRLQQDNDLEAARELVLSHLRFVVHIARGYGGYGLPLGDLVQEGNVGLMKAVKRFDPSLNVRLVSFAVHWIRAEIHEYVLRNWRIVKVATTKAQRKLFFNLRGAKKRLGWLSSAEVNRVADDLGVKAETVLEMEARLAGQDVAFDPAPGFEQNEDAPSAPASFLADERAADPAELLESSDWEASTHARLQDVLETLDERSRDIVTRRWLGDSKATLQALAEEYGVSAERVRQIESSALKKIKLGFVEA
jgi:RNA polymerase sigma-32 factor